MVWLRPMLWRAHAFDERGQCVAPSSSRQRYFRARGGRLAPSPCVHRPTRAPAAIGRTGASTHPVGRGAGRGKSGLICRPCCWRATWDSNADCVNERRGCAYLARLMQSIPVSSDRGLPSASYWSLSSDTKHTVTRRKVWSSLDGRDLGWRQYPSPRAASEQERASSPDRRR